MGESWLNEASGEGQKESNSSAAAVRRRCVAPSATSRLSRARKTGSSHRAHAWAKQEGVMIFRSFRSWGGEVGTAPAGECSAARSGEALERDCGRRLAHLGRAGRLLADEGLPDRRLERCPGVGRERRRRVSEGRGRLGREGEEVADDLGVDRARRRRGRVQQQDERRQQDRVRARFWRGRGCKRSASCAERSSIVGRRSGRDALCSSEGNGSANAMNDLMMSSSAFILSSSFSTSSATSASEAMNETKAGSSWPTACRMAGAPRLEAASSVLAHWTATTPTWRGGSESQQRQCRRQHGHPRGARGARRWTHLVRLGKLLADERARPLHDNLADRRVRGQRRQQQCQGKEVVLDLEVDRRSGATSGDGGGTRPIS